MIPLTEHDAAGRIRYFLEGGADPDKTHRPIERRSDAIPNLARGWVTAQMGCRGCGATWAAITVDTTDLGPLECYRCGGTDTGVVTDGWCSACGWTGRVLPLPEGTTAPPCPCPACNAPLFVDEPA